VSSFLFIYPQLRKMSGAERLIIELAAHTARLGHGVKIAAHYIGDDCRSAIPPEVQTADGGRPLKLFGNHYLDAGLEYLLAPTLVGRAGLDHDAIVFFGGPGLPALYWTKTTRHPRDLCMYFCYEPPRFAYTDTREVAGRLGPLEHAANVALPLYRIADHLFVSEADRVLVNGDFGRRRVKEVYGLDSVIINHGVNLSPADPTRVHELRYRYGLDAGDPVVVTVNYLHPRKRIDLLVKAIGIIRRDIPQAKLLIVGSGPERSRLESLARELGLGDSVVFAGFVPDEDLGSHYALASVYSNPAKLESFGLSVIEALASGLPVVSVAEGGPVDTVGNGERGFLAEADAKDIAAKLKVLLKSPALAREMGEAGRAYVATHHQWSDGAATLISETQRLIESRRFHR
jgi:glycosyltransferase involved in cell wall biosynthesis